MSAVLRERFHAMGTGWEVLLDAPDGRAARRRLAQARARVARLEALLSRFRPDSELSRLNRERTRVVGPELMEVVRLALRMRGATGGRFDPAVGRAVVAAGYDRTFAAVTADGPAPGPPAPGGGAVEVDSATSRLTLAPGVVLDLGGIAKGHAADVACELLAPAGPCLVNAGGDVRASGPRRDGPWAVGVAAGDGTPRSLALSYGGLATSGTDRRRWRRAGRDMHHAIDPLRGAPAVTPLVRATAVAATCAEADALATALLVAGREAPRLADAWRVPAALAGADGGLRLAGGLA